jgi:hypothetical protein
MAREWEPAIGQNVVQDEVLDHNERVGDMMTHPAIG